MRTLERMEWTFVLVAGGAAVYFATLLKLRYDLSLAQLTLPLAVMAAGTGYMVYSAFKDNDPVKSQFR